MEALNLPTLESVEHQVEEEEEEVEPDLEAVVEVESPDSQCTWEPVAAEEEVAVEPRQPILLRNSRLDPSIYSSGSSLE